MGEVTLTGTVTRRQDKRAAEDIVERVSGVKNVENRLRVSDQTSSGSTSESTSESGVGMQSSKRRQTANNV